MDKHARRIDIFNNTLALLRQGWYTAPSGEKVEFPPVEEVMESAYMVDEPFHVLIDPAGPTVTEVRVENKDCVLAAKEVIEEDEFKNKFKRIVFAILDGYRTGLHHNPEGNLLPFQREYA